MKAYEHLIQFALASGHTISVHDGEEWPVKRSASATAIIDAVESVDEAVLKIMSADGSTRIAVATVSSFGLADDETVIDHTVNDFMDTWQTAYLKDEDHMQKILTLIGIALAMASLYMGATEQIDAASMVITTLASLSISIIAAIDSRNHLD